MVTTQLSEREADILKRLASGEPHKAVAAYFKMTRSGLNYHLWNMYQRFEVVNLANLLSYVIQNNLITVPKLIEMHKEAQRRA